MDIQNLMKYVNNRPTTEPSLKELALLKSQVEELKSKFVDLSKLPDGEILKGQVTDLKQNVLEVLTNKGQIFKGTLADNLPLNIGDVREFVVNNKNGNTTLSMVDIPKEAVQNDKISNTLKELGLKPDDKNLQIAKELLANKLPINKETLQQVKSGIYHVENSSNTDNALSKAIFLVKNNMPTTKEKVDTLNNINNKENTLAKNLDTVFSKLDALPDKALAKDISSLLDKFKSGLSEKLVQQEVQPKTEQLPQKTQEQIKADVQVPIKEQPQIQKDGILPKQDNTLIFDKDGKLLKKDLELLLPKEEVSKEGTVEKQSNEPKEQNFQDRLKNPKEFFKDVEDNLSDLKDKLTKTLKII